MARRATNYPPELRERAVRMVAEVRPEYPSDWPAICAVASRLGIGCLLVPWVHQCERAASYHAPQQPPSRLARFYDGGEKEIIIGGGLPSATMNTRGMTQPASDR